MNKILLDTHVFIWLINGNSLISKKSQQLIEKSRSDGNLFISAISVWEVAMLERKKRIILNKHALDWINASLSCGIRLLELTPEISIESCHLPDYVAGDPADRIIIATARNQDLVLLTADQYILAYGNQKHVATLDVRTY